MTQTKEGTIKMVETRRKNNSFKAWNKGIHMWKNKLHPKGMKGKFHSIETKKKIGLKSRRPKSNQSKNKMSNTMKKLWSNPNTKYNSLKYRNKRKQERQKFMETKGFINWLKSTRKGRNYKSIAEQKMKEIFINNNIKFIEQYKVENYFADFYLPDYNLIIECDGEYWHNYPNGTKKDWLKNKLYKEKGFKILRIWNQFIKEFDEKILLHIIELTIAKKGEKRGVIEYVPVS
jgi:very-short-patch-repair endonuclease